MKTGIALAVTALSLTLAPAAVLAGPGGGSPTPVYVFADLDGDQKTDKIVENDTNGFSVAYLLDGVVAPISGAAIPGTNTGAGYTTVAFPDLNGDGKSDKVIEHTSGYSVAYLMNGTTLLSAGAIPGTAAGYSTVGFPDLNGDGKADKVVENDTTGITVAFLMDGLTLLSAGAIPGTNIAAGYTTAGFPDIDGDGNADKVVEHTSGYTVAFLMDGLSVKASGAGPISGTNIAAGYATAGFPDVNGDGKADKVVENTASGYTVAFFLDGLTLLGASPIAGTSAGYTTVGFPDINGDDIDDKVIQRDSDGNSVAFLLNGSGALIGSGGIPGTDIANGWALSGFPDISGDGKADKVIEKTDGTTFGYVLDGIGFTALGNLPPTAAGFTQAPFGERWNP